MRVEHIATAESLDRLAGEWNELSEGNPFRSWEWHRPWIRHYLDERQLLVLTVRDCAGKLVGLAPWQIVADRTRGRIIRFLGSGAVCTDYLSLLVSPNSQDEAIGAISQWLLEYPGWDSLELEGVSATDVVAPKLAEDLVEAGGSIHRRNGANTWRIELPGSWEEYLAEQSKSHRKQIRRAAARLTDDAKLVPYFADDPSSLERGFAALIDLHQKRRNSLGQPGCFSCPRFSGFLREAVAGFLQTGALRLGWIEKEGRPIAAEIQLAGGGTTYAYQAGIDPDSLPEEPGRMMNIVAIQRAIQEGQKGFDFLRGDEPYKAHFRACPIASLELRISAPRLAAKVRHGVWATGDAVKQWIKTGMHLTGMH